MIYLKAVLLALCGIPFALNLPYMFHAWQVSNLDRWDWIFVLLFLLLGALQIKRAFARRKKGSWDYYALPPLVFFLVVAFAAKFFYQINGIAILASILFWWCVFWFALGWRGAFCMIPSFAVLLLSGTSTTYWLGVLLMLQGPTALTLKFIAAAALIIWEVLSRRFHLMIRRGTLCFGLVLVAGLLVLIQAGNLNLRQTPFVPDFSELQFEPYLGRRQTVSKATQNFFAHSTVEQYSFADDFTTYGVLAVECGDDIHEIHPASHCLRTTGATILSEYPVVHELHGQTINFSGIQARTTGGTALVVVWYSNEDFSTGNFLGFRRAWKPGRRWMTYQISTPVLNDDVEQARSRLLAFLQAIPSNLNPAGGRETSSPPAVTVP